MANNYVPPAYTPFRNETFPSSDFNGNFTAIKVGDVDCSCTKEDLEMLMEEEVVVRIKDRAIKKGEAVELIFEVSNFTKIAAYQFGLNFRQNLKGVKTIKGDLNGGVEAQRLGLSGVNNNKILATWLYDIKPLSNMVDTTLKDNTFLFALQFEALENISSLSQFITLDESTLLARAFDAKGRRHKISLEFYGDKSDNTPPLDDELTNSGFLTDVSCYPNPATKNLYFKLNATKDLEAEIKFFTSSGTLLSTREVQLVRGLQTIDIDGLSNWDNGLYYYSIRVDDTIFTDKFVKQE